MTSRGLVQAAPLLWAPGSCFQLFIGQGTQIQCGWNGSHLPLPCSCWVFPCCGECHMFPSHYLGVILWILVVSLKSKAFVLYCHCHQARYRQAGQCTALYRLTMGLSMLHITQSSTCCRFYDIDHFSDLKKQRGIYLADKFITWTSVNSFCKNLVIDWEINLYVYANVLTVQLSGH